MEATITITGVTPLIMHSDRSANPLSPEAKALRAVTKKTKKTDEDHEQIIELDWRAGLYFDDVAGPYVPGWNATKCLIEGARLNKGGASIERGVQITEQVLPLIYKGARDVPGLWADPMHRHVATVKNGTSRVVRCRPIFRQWALEIPVFFDETVVDPADLTRYMKDAGKYIGLGDARKMGYGRFDVSVEIRSEVAA